MKNRVSLLVDVDGVLAEYSGFRNGSIGKPIKGAREALEKLREKFKIVLFTTRRKSEVLAWAKKYRIPFDGYVQKPLNWLIVDDRAMQFKGDWKETLGAISAFKPWWKK